jgi:hypothetical protein
MKTEKFHRLTRQEWETVAKKLTHSELLVFYWLKSNDPYGDRYIEANTLDIAQALGISRRSVQRALVKLSELRLIDLAITRFQYRVRSSIENYEDATWVSPSDTHVAEMPPMSSGTPPMSSGTPPVSPETPPMSRSTPETPTPSDFQEPKTLKTNKTKKTLSEEREREIDVCLNKIPEVDREKFLQFARSKAAQLPDPPQLIEKWIASNIDWIKQEFDKAYPQEASTPVEDKGSAAAIADRFFEELHPAVKEGLSSGEISRLDRAYNGLYDSQGNWWKIHDWLDRDESPTTRAAAQMAIAALRQRFSTRREV